MVGFNLVEFLSTGSGMLIGGIVLRIVDKLCQRYCPAEVIEIEEIVIDTISEASPITPHRSKSKTSLHSTD